jgi:hypothetical protein
VLEAAARGDREKALARGGLKPEAQRLISVKQDLPAVWKQLTDAPAGQEVEVALPLDAEKFSGRFRGLDLRIERATVIARTKGQLGTDALRVRLDPPKDRARPPAAGRRRLPRARQCAPRPKSPGRRRLEARRHLHRRQARRSSGRPRARVRRAGKEELM